MNTVRGSSRRGFTLIELLSVVVIVVVLASLLVPAISRTRGMAESTKCVSNLRQVGAGISLYVGDNDGFLPGPLSAGLHAFYTAEDTLDPKKGGRLACFLQGYIAKPVATGPGFFRSDVFVCPSFARVTKSVSQNSLPYVRNGLSFSGGGAGTYAFGSGAGSDAATPPQRLASLAGYSSKPLSQVWAIQDLDADNPAYFFTKDNHTPRWLPDHPVHPTYKEIGHGATGPESKDAHPGAFRNALFFDFHVGRLDLESNPM